jgi:hypothetical protein
LVSWGAVEHENIKHKKKKFNKMFIKVQKTKKRENLSLYLCTPVAHPRKASLNQSLPLTLPNLHPSTRLVLLLHRKDTFSTNPKNTHSDSISAAAID